MKNATVIPVIVGPTSSGKTTLSIKVAKKLNAEIISADSRQVFKHMDIGTGKVPLSENEFVRKGAYYEIKGVKIWGYDLVLPGDNFSAYDFYEFGVSKIKELIENGKNVVIAGGTGFYIDVLTGKVKLSKVEPDPKLRRQLEQMEIKEVVKKLRKLNPDLAKTIDLKNKVRLIRAIEKELVVEKNNDVLDNIPVENNTKSSSSFCNIKFVHIGLTAPRKKLYQTVDSWLDQIWKELVEETKNLISLGYKQTRQLRGIIYKSVIDFLDGKLSEEEAKKRAKYDLHAYIRRQQTWFKKNEDISWIDITEQKPETGAFSLLNVE